MHKLLAEILKNLLDNLMAGKHIDKLDVPVAAQNLDSMEADVASMGSPQPVVEQPAATLTVSSAKTITIGDYLMNRATIETLDQESLENAHELLRRVNTLLATYSGTIKVNSGYRRPEDNDAAGGRPKSRHLTCQAIDIGDVNGVLKKWATDNITLLEQCGLWCEDIAYTPQWLHLQSVPPKSGKRFFIP